MTDPRDHTLALAAQLASTMTTLANVTAKVRVNGGAATTYTNVSTPAITQNADITYGYKLQIPASTYTDGDVVEATWLYSGTPYAYETHVIGLAEVDGAHYTTARGDNLANLDATISSRNAVAPDNADIQSLRADLTTARAAKLDLIGSASITFTGPVLSGGGVVVYQGDDYYNADGRALSWTSSSFPTLTGATISFQLRNGALTKAGVVASATQAYVELSHTDLASLTPSQAQQYTLIATLSNGHVVTLAQGPFLCETRP